MLTSLRLQDFRCFSTLKVPMGKGTTVFVGANAQGKTTLLEAVCVLLRLQSPRARGRAELVRFGAPAFGVAGRFGDHDLKVQGSAAARDLAVDGEPVARGRDFLAASGLVVWMANDDLNLVRGPGESRRRFLDFLASQVFPGYRDTVRRYDMALRSRNALLRRDRSSGRAGRELAPFTDIMVEAGAQVVGWRRELVAWLAPEVARAHDAVGGGSGESLELAFAPDTPAADLEAAMASARETDARRGMTTRGPHRDDLRLTIDRRPADKFASEGQQRTIALALKLGQAWGLRDRTGSPPLLLLDDIFGELDPVRRNALLACLPEHSQKLITATNLEWARFDPDAHPPAIFDVADGTVTRRTP